MNGGSRRRQMLRFSLKFGGILGECFAPGRDLKWGVNTVIGGVCGGGCGVL